MPKGLSKEQRKELRDKIKVLKDEIKKAKEVPKFDKNNDTIIEWLENYKKEKGSYYTPYALRMVRFCVSHGIEECTRVKANGEKKRAEKKKEGEAKRIGRPKLSEECKKELKEEKKSVSNYIKSLHDKHYRYYIEVYIPADNPFIDKNDYLRRKFKEENENPFKVLCGVPVEPFTKGINDRIDLENFLYGYERDTSEFVPSLYKMAFKYFVFRSDGTPLRGLRTLMREIGAEDVRIPKK